MFLQELLEIELPIIQAPMAGAQDAALTIAVSNAGGLGSLPAGMLSADELRQQLELIARTTRRPYSVNFFCHAAPVINATREAFWRELLAPYYEEYGVDVGTIQIGMTRRPFGDDALDVLSAFEPPVVSFHFGLPAPELLARVRAWKPVILSSATTVEEAHWLESRGVDGIIAQGVEAGGHRGTFLSESLGTRLETSALLTQIVQAVTVPVIAAGGIAGPDEAHAAIALGAAGVQVGTSYLLCPESTTRQVHRAALRSPQASITTLTNVFSGRPARGIVNRLVRELGPMNPLAPPFPLAANAIGPLRAAAEARGSGEFSPLWAGQNTRGCRNIPAAQLTRELAAHL